MTLLSRMSQSNCRTLPHVHPGTCMCGALCDLLAVRPHLPTVHPSSGLGHAMGRIFLLNTQTGMYTRKYPSALSLSFYEPIPPRPPPGHCVRALLSGLSAIGK